MSATKIVPGTAVKEEDVKRFYSIALERFESKGRPTEQGNAMAGMIKEVFDAEGINEIPLQVAVEYIRERTGNFSSDEERQALVGSLQSYLRSKGGKATFKTYRAGNGLKYITKKED
jgi:hypothetical protein